MLIKSTLTGFLGEKRNRLQPKSEEEKLFKSIEKIQENEKAIFDEKVKNSNKTLLIRLTQ